MRKSLELVIGLLVGVALIEIAIPQLGFFWHLAHTDQVVMDGHLFTVPSKYFLSGSEGRLTFTRFSPVVPLIAERSAIAGPFAKMNMIGIYKHDDGKSFDRDADYFRLKEWLANEVKQAGLSLESERSLSTQLGTAYCFQSNGSQMAEVRCFLDGSKVSVLFMGEPRFANDVYQVVSGVTRVN
ncbi:MAG TPA: hypothetical protein VN622_04530 [Clostridia bacterium]|nr:hypothetical protein [Clostridia bacterium]